MGRVGAIVFLIGLFSFLIGGYLYYEGNRSRGSMETQWGKFSGPVWFILIAFGIVLMVVGATLPV
jgi:uncharacterized membrane protein YhhN